MKELILQKIKDFSLDFYEPIVLRDLYLGEPPAPKAGNLVTVITGMRRSGKTYRLFQEMKSLREKGVPWNRMLYFNFEDGRLFPLDSAVGDEVLSAFYSANSSAYEDGAYFFFDEIQEMKDWEIWMRRLVDTRKTTIFVTGSSSKLLSSDVATSFRGRSINYELLPYGFSEYVRVHANELACQSGAVSSKEETCYTNLFRSYLQQGGFPAVQEEVEPRLVMMLQSYVSNVVAKDVIERHNLNNPQAVILFAQRALALNGRELSLRKLENDFRSLGVTANRMALADALRYFEDAFLLGTIRRFSRSVADNARSPVKVYTIDPGLAYANSLSATQDLGQRLECAVYLELRRRNSGLRQGVISSLRTSPGYFEVDFIVGDALAQAGFALYQVSLNLEDSRVRKRELRALEEAMAQFHLRESYVIVLDGKSEAIEMGNGVIHVIPAWRWFLEGSRACSERAL